MALLQDRPATAAELATHVEVPVSTILTDIDHVSRSLGADERVEAVPPECRDCGFTGFDDLANVPSRCPDCKSQDIADPVFRIREVE